MSNNVEQVSIRRSSWDTTRTAENILRHPLLMVDKSSTTSSAASGI